MKCRKAREILNILMDGELHPLAREAREHVDACEGCRQWHASMERVLRLAEASHQSLPELDISSAVMARLPERHPASVTRREGRRFPRRILVWVGAAWLVGAMALIMAGLGVSHWLTGESGVQGVVAAAGFAHTAVSSLDGVLPALGTLIPAAQSILTALAIAAARLSPLIIGLSILDCAVIVMIVAARRRRRAVAGVFLTLA